MLLKTMANATPKATEIKSSHTPSHAQSKQYGINDLKSSLYSQLQAKYHQHLETISALQIQIAEEEKALFHCMEKMKRIKGDEEC